MQRLSYSMFVVFVLMTVAFIVATTGELPERVASHFGANNLANGWMTRDGYRLFMLLFATLLPVVVVGSVAWLPRCSPNAISLPNRGYWLDPKRRDATMAALAGHASWLGCLIALFIAGVHYLVLEANRASPAQMPAALFWMLLIGFLAGVALWIGALHQRFRNTH
jgi:hypothetical protein